MIVCWWPRAAPEPTTWAALVCNTPSSLAWPVGREGRTQEAPSWEHGAGRAACGRAAGPAGGQGSRGAGAWRGRRQQSRAPKPPKQPRERERSLLAPSPDPGGPPSPPPPGRPSCPLRDLSKGLERTIITELVTKIKGSPKIPVSRPQASSPEDPAEVGPARAGPQCAAWRGPRALQEHSLAGLPCPRRPPPRGAGHGASVPVDVGTSANLDSPPSLEECGH